MECVKARNGGRPGDGGAGNHGAMPGNGCGGRSGERRRVYGWYQSLNRGELVRLRMNIIKAKTNQYEAVRSFYHSLIDGMKGSPYAIGWEKDIYPAPDFLKDSIENGELYICTEDNQMVGAMVLNHQCNDGYSKFQWQTEASADEILIIHALGVHPAHSGKGYAKAMVKKAFEVAANTSQKALRLDVLGGNVPAERLYTGLGFRYMDTLQMYYEDTGWTDYELYEYVLN